MITTTGKSIIAKYLLGQVTDYASYIAIGCGPKPLDLNDSFGNYSDKENLDFEMLRVPIISRGLITENSISKVVLTAELPTENRYDISEIGVFSAGSNPAVGAFSSRPIFQFSGGEGWTYNSATPSLVTASIDNGSGDVNTSITEVSTGAFYINSDNGIFNSGSRVSKYEKPRNQMSSLLMSGIGSTPLIMTGVNLDLDKYSVNDELRLAFAAVSSKASETSLGKAQVIIEFAYSSAPDAVKATMTVSGSSTSGISNKYFVGGMTLGAIAATAVISGTTTPVKDFSWASVNVIRVYTQTYGLTESTINSTTASSDHYIALDGLRIENAQSNNPAYGMIGYSVIKTNGATVITKDVNSPAYIEFRFALDVN